MSNDNTTTRTPPQNSDNENHDVKVMIDETAQQPPLKATMDDLEKLLNVIEHKILPITRVNVANGNKVFGAAVLDSNNLENVVLAGSNEETECPLFHGEVKVIYDWSKQIPASERGQAAQNSIFLATHEP